MTTPTIPGFPYGPVYRRGQRVTFTEDPQDYIGQHRFHVDPVMVVDPNEPTVAPVAADDNWLIGADYAPRHYAEVTR